MSDVERNRAAWTTFAPDYASWAPGHWSRDEVSWGIWHTPESAVQVLGDVSGLDVLDLGCGTGYFSGWLARRGARPVGVDVTPAQLATARAMQERFSLRFPLVEANAEQVPFREERFDLVLSEYGASIWCDPYRWIPEAARLLRPSGRLIFLRNSTILMLTMGELGGSGTQLRRDYFGMHRFD
ncbi:MAG TPA: class I SAM-dependent methyltransferase, partial [Actinomycetota bacterium]|nr:class I SAM-dependent methyltransferase [Actinomycetota bacterium]